MQTKANLQDLFLLRARRDKLPVTMFLMNGFQMRGTITGFDAFVVVLDSDGRQQIIYKRWIWSVRSRPPRRRERAAAKAACGAKRLHGPHARRPMKRRAGVPGQRGTLTGAGCCRARRGRDRSR